MLPGHARTRATTKGTRAGSNNTVRVRVLVLISCSIPTATRAQSQLAVIN